MRRFLTSLALLATISATLIYGQQLKGTNDQGKLTKLNEQPKPARSFDQSLLPVYQSSFQAVNSKQVGYPYFVIQDNHFALN